MSPSEYGSRPWLKFHPADFYSSRAVRGLDRMQQLRYLGAIFDSWLTSEPGVATEDEWRDLLGYQQEEWSPVRSLYARCFDTTSRPGLWVQTRLVEEHEGATARSSAARAKAARMHETRLGLVRKSAVP